MGFAQRGPLQMRHIQFSALQVCPTQDRSLQMDGGHIASFGRSVSLLPIESSQHMAERQMMQVDLLQVSPSQIYAIAFTLLLIVAINRPSSMLMRREKPLDIS